MKQFLHEGAIQNLEQLEIGIVDKVSPSSIEVVLNSEAPHNISLNTGTPVVFPRINSYLLIPNEHGYLVGVVSSLEILRDNIHLNNKAQREEVLGISTSRRKLYLVPLGVMKVERNRQKNSNNSDGNIGYRMERGTIVFPTIGDAVHIPTRIQLEAVLAASKEEDKRVSIGSLAHDPSIDITVDPDKIFGRHLAVLGNTGSGKSCTIAGLIRWSIEAAQEAVQKERKKNQTSKEVNANFIILDVNGEYSKAFKDYIDGGKALLLHAHKDDAGTHKKGEQLKVPCNIFTRAEWAAFANPAPQKQYPHLMDTVDTFIRDKHKYFTWEEFINQLGPGDNYTMSMVERVENLLGSGPINKIINGVDVDKNTWINNIHEKKNQVIIIDLSSISDEVLHLIVSVIARQIFESHQEEKKDSSMVITTLVLEEAHRFIGYSYQKKDEAESLSSICSRSFSRIAREGRKFGLNLMVSSQMPHEISQKVLAQCNTFLLHRIVSANDQDYVNRLIPDSLRGLMDGLPGLPSQYAFLLGHATPIPKLVKIKDLKEDHRPDSEDPQIWKQWTGASE